MNKVNKSEKIGIVEAFANQIKKSENLEHCLKISVSNFSIFNLESLNIHIADGLDWKCKINNDSKFDLILGDFPLGWKPNIDCEFGAHKIKVRRNWAEMLAALNFLEVDGIAIFLVEPTVFSSNEGIKVEDALNSEGFFINAIFNAPEDILRPETAIAPVFVVITKKSCSSVFVAELLDKDQSRELVTNFFSSLKGNSLKSGIMIPSKSFHSFHRIKIKQQIEKLETQYKEYEEYSLGELATEINYVKSGSSLTEKDNSIYIPKIGTSLVISKISNANIKHHNYFQVVLGDKAVNEYMAAFFRSDIGRLILESLTSGTFIAHLNKKELEQAPIALPTIEDQKQIVSTQRKLHDLKQTINLFERELALNPVGSKSIFSQLDDMVEAVGGLTIIDKIRSILRHGESKTSEFKETLSLCLREKTKKAYVELAVLKTIVAFLNTEGGFLLVGVNDDGVISGVDAEIAKFYKNIDSFLLKFKNLIKERIGEEFYPFIEYNAIQVEGKYLLMVECKESPSPCYLDNSTFYVRTNPATDKLEGPKLVEYVKNHFDQ